MKRREILAMGVVLTGLSAAMWAVLQPYNRGRKTLSCQSNLKQIGLGFSQYMRDYDERAPLATNWRDALHPYIKAPDSLFQCPTAQTFYALNRHIASTHYAAVKDFVKTPLAFDSTTKTRNSSGDEKLWPTPLTHQLGGARGNNVLFFDGHVKLLEKKPVFRSFAAENAAIERAREQRWKDHEAREKRRQEWEKRLQRAQKLKKSKPNQ